MTQILIPNIICSMKKNNKFEKGLTIFLKYLTNFTKEVNEFQQKKEMILENCLFLIIDRLVDRKKFNFCVKIDFQRLLHFSGASLDKLLLTELIFLRVDLKEMYIFHDHFSPSLLCFSFLNPSEFGFNFVSCLKMILQYTEVWLFDCSFLHQDSIIYHIAIYLVETFCPPLLKAHFKKKLKFLVENFPLWQVRRDGKEIAARTFAKVISHHFAVIYKLRDLSAYKYDSTQFHEFHSLKKPSNYFWVEEGYHIYNILNNEYGMFLEKSKNCENCWECQNIKQTLTYLENILAKLQIHFDFAPEFSDFLLNNYLSLVYHGPECIRKIKKGILAFITYQFIFENEENYRENHFFDFAPARICALFDISLDQLLAGEIVCLKRNNLRSIMNKASPSVLCERKIYQSGFSMQLATTVRKILLTVEKFFYREVLSQDLIYAYVKFIFHHGFADMFFTPHFQRKLNTFARTNYVCQYYCPVLFIPTIYFCQKMRMRIKD